MHFSDFGLKPKFFLEHTNIYRVEPILYFLKFWFLLNCLSHLRQISNKRADKVNHRKAEVDLIDYQGEMTLVREISVQKKSVSITGENNDFTKLFLD